MTKEEYIKAFVEGAKWWEFEKTGATMWQSDQILAEETAGKRWDRKAWQNITIGVIEHNGNSD